MSHKQVLYRSEAREKILRGTAKLADAIRVTLGPRGVGECGVCYQRVTADRSYHDGTA
jgi:hypothetical protein